VILSASLILGNSVSANHFTCVELAEQGVKFVKSRGEKAEGEIAHGKPGMISPDEYDKCLIDNFENSMPGYTIKVTKKDWRHFNGTTYFIMKILTD
jgi:hypothetical protein